MSFAERLAALRSRIAAACRAHARDPAEVRILPVSKMQPIERIHDALACGFVELGENRVHELADKATALATEPVRWHLIGSLQTNKVKELVRVERLAFVQSLDREKLADTLQAALVPLGKTLDVLIEVQASEEKHGVAPQGARALLDHVRRACPSLRVRGLMAMAALEGDPNPAFAMVSRLRAELEQGAAIELPILSMGMSGDLEAAIAHGSTMVRVGTALFGGR